MGLNAPSPRYKEKEYTGEPLQMKLLLQLELLYSSLQEAIREKKVTAMSDTRVENLIAGRQKVQQ